MKTRILILVLCFTNFFVSYSQNREYDIITEGAFADGVTLNTEIIQKAIDKVSLAGGGKIVFPAGKYLSGSLFMQSNVELHFEKNAVLLGSTNPDHYFDNDGNQLKALLIADKVENIALTGEGCIDGQGLKLALAVDSLHHSGIRTVSYNIRRMRPNEVSRPKLFYFEGTDKIVIKDLKLRNSSCWGLHFELCNDIIINNINFVNRAYWNNDGLDISDCHRVRVTNSYFDTADDGICLKSHNIGKCNDGIYVSDCIVKSSASAIKFGTASFGGFKNIVMERIKIYDTFRSAIAIESVDGAEIENVTIRDIVAKNTGNAIFIRLGLRTGDKPGYVRNVNIEKVKVEVPFDRPDIDYDIRGPEVNFFHNPFPSSIVGIPGYDVENVSLQDIHIVYPGRASKGMAYVSLSRLQQVSENIDGYPEFSMFGELPSWGFYVRHVKGLTLKNIKLILKDYDFRPAFVFDDVQDIEMENIQLPDTKSGGDFYYNNCAHR